MIFIFFTSFIMKFFMRDNVAIPIPLPNQTKTIPAKKTQIDQKSLLPYRIMIFFRFILAILGGYALSAVTAMCIALMFPETIKASTVMSATMLAFVIHCAVFIWVFMVQSTLKAWLGVVVPIVILSLVYWLLR